MKILSNLSIVFLSLITVILIACNIFYLPIRKFLEANFLKIEMNNDELTKLNEQYNTDYQLKIETDKKVYLKFEKIKLFARIVEKADQKIPENTVIQAEFYNNGTKIRNIDGADRVTLVYYRDQQVWIGYYFPENPGIEGKIDITASGFIDNPEAPVISKNSFVINETGPKFVLDKGQVFMGIDSLERISKRSILSVEGKEVDWNYIPEWVNFISADGIIMLSGITKTFQEDITLDSPWDIDKINESIALAGMIGKREKHFGVYAKCLNVEGVDTKKMGYKTVSYFKGDGYEEDPSCISILDDNRKKSIIKLLTSAMANENIAYVGMSDIFMPGNYGVELIDNYFSDCGISVPAKWETLDFNEKFEFIRNRMKVPAEQNRFYIWKLYFTADYIRDIVEKTGHKKPIFYRMDYKLLMENPLILPALLSAGVDFVIIDFNINYDKIPESLEGLSKNPFISNYLNRLIISYYFDYQNMDVNGFEMSAIENFVRANLQLLKNGSSSQIANGIMINDLYKIMFGRRGPYTPNEWMLGVGEIVYLLKQSYSAEPVVIKITSKSFIPDKKEISLVVEVENTTSEKVNNFKIEYLTDAGKLISRNDNVKEILPGKEVNFSVSLQIGTNSTLFLRKKNFLGFRVSWDKNVEKYSRRSGFLFFEPINVEKPADETGKKDRVLP